MKATEKLEKLNQLANNIQQAVSELESDRNVDFFKSLIQSKAIEIYELAGTYDPQLKDNKVHQTPEPIQAAVVQQNTVVETVPKKETVVEQIVEPIKEKVKETIVAETIKTPIPEPVVESKPQEKIQVKETKKVLEKTFAENAENEEDEVSLNERISKTKTPVSNVVEKSKETPISDIAKSISISKKFEFINGLFDGNSEAYKLCIQKVQNANNLEEANHYLDNEIANQFEWNENEKLSEEFYTLTRRRFLK
jgi:hypothetical protein